ncbi:hypothetical protein ALC62_03235, partial [Cyphomyrmex costatus]
ENDVQNTSSVHNENLNLALDIRNWAISACINKKILSDLLKILRKYGHKDLPSDARTLLKTSKSVELIDMKPGKYYHFGLHKGLIQSVLTYYTKDLPEEIKFNTHVDGLPLSKSSGTQMWPILASICDEFYTEPFIIGAYVGDTKPADCNDFLKYYCEEVKMIKENGLFVKEQKISCFPHLFIADAPARAYITCVKYHSGYNSCSFCVQEGEYIKNRVTFPEINAPLRTDESFLCKLDDDHHRGTSVLENLNIGMVSQFPIDYMHNVCIGFKSVLRWWIFGKQDVRMTKLNIEEASSHLIELRKSIPDEFARKLRPLTELDRYKATELRQLLLYTGPVIFWKRLPDDKYYHFLSLSIGIRILCSEEFHIRLNDYARTLLIYYVQNYGKLYLNKKTKNSYVYIDDGNIVQIIDMYLENNIVLKTIGTKAMFVKPCESTVFNICVLSKQCLNIQDNIILPASRIQQKCVKLKLNINESAIFPLLHKD